MRAVADDSMFNPLAPQMSEADRRLFVQFHLAPMENPQKSVELGRPVFDEVEFVKIAVPGDKDNVVDRPATELDKRRFGPLYAAWKSGQQSGESGTPLKEWPAITRSQVEELAYFNVRTVEQLASMPDGNAQKFPGIQALRQRAKDFLEQAKGTAPAAKLRAELEQRDSQISALQDQIRQLAEKVEAKGKGKS